MDFSFLTDFNPRIIDVVERERKFWELFEYDSYGSRQTRLYALAFVHCGTGMFELDDFSSFLQAGSLFHVSPGSCMTITTTLDNPLCFYSIHFDYRTLKWRSETGDWIIGPTGPLPFPRAMLVNEDTNKKHELKNSFHRTFLVWNEKKMGYEWYAKLGFMEILGQISRLQDPLNHEDRPSVQAIGQSIEYIKSHLKDDLSRDALAKEVSLSPSYFSTLFKGHTGYSPVEYITKLRMDHAKHLLRSSRMPIHDIAKEVGFADPFYFTRVFKRTTSLSPRDYRRT